jgi:phenylacetate-CoA ligase
MYQWLYRNLLLPTFETGIKRRNTFRYWRELEQSQWQPRLELERVQLAALRRLLDHAFRHCSYYREEWLGRSLDPGRLESLADFARWPVINGGIIHSQRQRMRVPGIQLLSKSTGGSSGAPLQFDLDYISNDKRTAAWYRGYSWAGAWPGTKQLYLWGVPLGSRPRWKEWKDALYNRLQRRLVLNTFDLSEDRVPDFLRRLNRYRPDFVVAYTNPLYCFARSLQERGLQPHVPKALIVGAEKLHGFQRKLIESVFSAPVFETYGCREVMLIGAECDRHDGLHLTMENLLVEILDDRGRPTPPGEEGNVVLTDLYNYGMPFIRYANGDRALAGFAACSCGRGLPLLRQVIGRRLDVLHTPDGRRVPGEFFPHLLKDFSAVRQFQVVQEQADCIQLRIVLSEDWRDADRNALNGAVRKVIGPAVRFELQPVSSIPLTPAGKQQVVVNRLQASRVSDDPG